MKKATNTVFGRTAPGVKPNMEGVRGEMVSAASAPEGLVFGNRKVSPYDAALKELVAAGTGKLLRFGDLRARTSILVRAKKLGLRVSCAENEGVLWVRFDGRAEDDLKGTRREKLLALLKTGPKSTHQLNIAVRDSGDATFDATFAEVILAQLVRDGEVVRQEGGNWALNPRRDALRRATA